MQTIETQSHIGADGALRLSVPVNLPESAVDVIVIVQPRSGTENNGNTGKGWPPGFFEKTFGCMADDPSWRSELNGGRRANMKSAKNSNEISSRH